MFNHVVYHKLRNALSRKLEALEGRLFHNLEDTLNQMVKRPMELHLELTNICNARCIFCPYPFQQRPESIMADTIFYKAVDSFVQIGGGRVGLTPVVGDALIDPQFLKRVKYIRQFPEITEILLTTNAILMDRFGVEEILKSGITAITISTSGFDKESYERIYRSTQYERMKNNVTKLFKKNHELGNPVNLKIVIRTDRSLNQVLTDVDFQPIKRFNPNMDVALAYSNGGGKIKDGDLPASMKFRWARKKKEPCVNLYHGPFVYWDGKVGACFCVTSMDAGKALYIGNLVQEQLLDIWVGKLMNDIRNQFYSKGTLNEICAKCDAYVNLDLFRTKEGRERAELNSNKLRDYLQVTPVKKLKNVD